VLCHKRMNLLSFWAKARKGFGIHQHPDDPLHKQMFESLSVDSPMIIICISGKEWWISYLGDLHPPESHRNLLERNDWLIQIKYSNYCFRVLTIEKKISDISETFASPSGKLWP
jgi:hypothetical protein